MCNFRPLALGLVLVSLAGVSWGEPCSTLAPSECSNVGCVNEKMRSCRSRSEVKKVSETSAGKENINICLRRLSSSQSKGPTVDAVLAAMITCRNKEAFKS